MEAPFSVKLASGKRVEGFKKRVVIVSAKDGIRVLKEGREKYALPANMVHSVKQCDQKTHGDRCVVVDGGAVHLKANTSADAKQAYSIICELVAQNGAAVKRNTPAAAALQSGLSEADAELMASVFGGSGLPAVDLGIDEAEKEEVDVGSWRAHYPVVLVPGLASSALDVVSSLDSSFRGKRVWIGLGSLAAGKMFSGDKSRRGPSPRRARKKEEEEEEGDEDAEVDVLAMMLGGAGRSTTLSNAAELSSSMLRGQNKWLKHMCLNENRDGYSDPPGIQTRPVAGVAGCAYLSKDKLSSPLSYVFGYMVDALKRVGYVEGVNLHAATYDWRCALSKLEDKYQYFSQLQQTVQKLRQSNGRPVMLIAHSMGNRVTQWFLHWVALQPGGQAWIDENVAGFLACGAPWLGAPKILRALTTGDRMDLDMFLTRDEGHELVRSCGSLPALLPRQDVSDAGWRFPWAAKTFSVLRHGDKFLDSEKLFVLGRVDSTVQCLKNLYEDDPVWQRIMERPPVKKLFNIIGVNLPTEFCYSFIEQSEGFVLDPEESNSKYIESPGYLFSQGIYYESEKFGGAKTASSGDGTVPLASLMYATTAWDATHIEIPDMEHRAMLKDPRFIQEVLKIICDELK